MGSGDVIDQQTGEWAGQKLQNCPANQHRELGGWVGDREYWHGVPNGGSAVQLQWLERGGKDAFIDVQFDQGAIAQCLFFLNGNALARGEYQKGNAPAVCQDG